MTDPVLDARRFGIACLFGLGLGLYYGFLRPLRPKHTVLSDLLFLPAMFYSWLYLSFAVCQGDIRLGYSIGLLVGALVFQWTGGRWLRPVFRSFWQGIGKIYRHIFNFLKKFLKKTQKIAFFLFPRRKK